MFSIRSDSQQLESADLTTLGAAVAQRLRHLLPVQWTAVVLHDDNAAVFAANRRVLGADGNLPSWLDPTSDIVQAPADVSVVPIYRLDTGVVLLVAGAQLDGGGLAGIPS